ncbi:hypothetical protein L0657_02120 [Dyadobacter sp. CY345]|uniref:hypothetical protein n=1 Tax=Dyadobacter sp. CY345 TaxID=2909335 RepID=UPI001F25D91E|nr:hypothetical protein [Dyadobacter sp. CY345]MCF2442736.1 hypothetical protein [Dyadobacter sp. CY345]
MKKIQVNTSHILKFLTALTAFAALFMAGCNRNSEDENQKLTGKFVNGTFLSKVSDSIPGLIPVYCYQLDFNGTDSVDVLYGFEQTKLAYQKTGNKYKIINALKDEDMIFVLNEDEGITLIDSAWNGTTKNSTFKKSKSNFVTALNERIIAGEYKIFKDDKQTPQNVTLNADGTISGLEKFTNYTLCYSGDCVSEIYPISNSITFSNEKTEKVMYAFKIDKIKKSLEIYHIEAPIRDIKGERAVKGVAFDLRQ